MTRAEHLADIISAAEDDEFKALSAVVELVEDALVKDAGLAGESSRRRGEIHELAAKVAANVWPSVKLALWSQRQATMEWLQKAFDDEAVKPPAGLSRYKQE